VGSRDFFKEISGVFTSNVIAIAVGLIIGIIISRTLGPQGKGIYSSILVLPIIFISLSLLGTRQTTIYLIGHQKYPVEKIISNLIIILLISSIIGILICIIYYVFFEHLVFSFYSVIIILITIPFVLVINYSGSIFLGLENFRMANILKWVTAILNLLFVLFFLFLKKLSITTALVSISLPNIIIAVLSLIYISKEYKIILKPDKLIIKGVLSKGLGFTIALLVIQLNYRLDIILLQFLSNMQEVGFYSIGVSVAENLWLFPTAVGIVINSISAKTHDVKILNEDISRLIRITFLCVFILSVLLYFVVPFFLPLFFGEKFYNSVPIVRILLPGILFFVIVRILSSFFAGIGRPNVITIIFLPALILNIGLNFYFIPIWGGIGAAIATNISYIIGAIAVLIVYLKLVKTSFIEMFTYRKSDFVFITHIKNFIQKKNINITSTINE